ncbi:MAG TPA: hypothetical protein VGQ67_08195 [Candidatus Polarisedimenticolia bacterium]|jgi:hypothetical protein|nr:hypothetical protein [Candidatus Polarisedimenticolia bacterium]
MSHRSYFFIALAVSALLLSWPPAPGSFAGTPPPPPPPAGDEPAPDADAQALLSSPPPVQPPIIESAVLPPQPPAGKGRIAIAVGGTRRWCTFPDDRVVKPPEGPHTQKTPGNRNPVYTFGYQFTIAAVERSHPQETILLFASPVFRTAVMRQAAKLGRGQKPPPKAPTIGAEPDKISLQPESPLAIVPLWQEEYRCVTLPESLSFDVDPGTYDVYMAFDIMLRSGGWSHRSVAFATDVGVAEGGAQRLDATVSVVAGGRRDVELKSAASPTPAPAGAAAR